VNKLPVGRTISQTYGFAISRYLSILGVIWLPFVVIGAAGYFYLLPALSNFAGVMHDIAQHRMQAPQTPYLPPGLFQMMGGIFMFEFVVLLVFPVMAVGITKEAMGLRRGPMFVYLSIGKAELLVFAGCLTLAAIYFVGVIVMAIVGGIVGAVVGAAAVGTSGAHADLVAVTARSIAVVRVLLDLFYLVAFYFMVRFAFLMVPVTTAEGRFGVWRSWTMTKGNFWRIFGVVLGTMLPVLILEYAILFVVFGPGLFTSMVNAQLHPATANDQLSAMFQTMIHYAVYGWVVALAIGPIWYGLMLGQSAFAYRALSAPEHSAFD
jgi:hypothetical protein